MDANSLIQTSTHATHTVFASTYQPVLKTPTLHNRRAKMTSPKNHSHDEFSEDLRLFGWSDPNYNKSVQFKIMKEQINGQSGSLDQRFCYFDHQSGEDWFKTTNEFNFYLSCDAPYPWISATILSHLENNKIFDQEAIKFIGLGSGDAMHEIDLLKNLLNMQPMKATLFLLDLSDYLLHVGYHNAETHLSHRGVVTIPMERDFYKLPGMPQLFYRPTYEKPRQLRVGCLFSNTFGNLSNEVEFLQNSLSAFLPGDLFMVVVSLKHAPATKPKAILKEDPRFSNYPGKQEWERWIMGPVLRYYDGLEDIELRSVLDNHSSPIQNGYTIRIDAIVNKNRVVTVNRVRRYDMDTVIKTFVENGWKSLGGKLFGEDQKRVCLIFERK